MTRSSSLYLAASLVCSVVRETSAAGLAAGSEAGASLAGASASSRRHAPASPNNRAAIVGCQNWVGFIGLRLGAADCPQAACQLCYNPFPCILVPRWVE